STQPMQAVVHDSPRAAPPLADNADGEPAARDPDMQRTPAPARAPELTPILVETPPFGYELRASPTIEHKGPPPKLRKVSQARNQIIDDQVWLFEIVGESPIHHEQLGPDGGLFQSFGNEELQTTLPHGDHDVFLYGEANIARHVGIFEKDQFTA